MHIPQIEPLRLGTILLFRTVFSSICTECDLTVKPAGCLPPRTITAPGEKWGYYSIRPHAHTFYWMFYTQSPNDYMKTPTILWLQGGPGNPSTSFGNLLEFGPLDESLKPRNFTWAKLANLIFVDNPVGTGFSYVTDYRAYTFTLDQVAADLLTFASYFFKDNPDLQDSPLFVFGQSYGGKWVSAFARELSKASRNGEIKCNFQGIAMGNSLLHAPDLLAEWPNFLYQTSMIDYIVRKKAEDFRRPMVKAFAAQEWKKAGKYLNKLMDCIFSKWTDFYNIRKFFIYKVKGAANSSQYDTWSGINARLDRTINGPVRKKLRIIPEDAKGEFSGAVYGNHSDHGGFYQPVTHIISDLLYDTDLRVTIYQGQWDIACPTSGAMKYASQRIIWPGQKGFIRAPLKTVVSDPRTGRPSVFVKAFKNLKFYSVMDAGHEVPMDNPAAAFEMVKRILGDMDR